MIDRFATTLATALVIASLVGCGSTPGPRPAPGVSEPNYEGLVTVASRAFDVAQVRPDTDFRTYSGLQFVEPELAFRTPDRAEREFPLSEEQIDRFRDGLIAAFEAEFEGFTELDIVDEQGPDTLALDIRVEDIVATVAPSAVGRAGRAAALLEASAAAVIIVEVRDSESNEILARGVDAGTARGGARRTSGNEMQVRFESGDRVVARWASITRAGLVNLLNEQR
jgi:hypothetical protein